MGITHGMTADIEKILPERWKEGRSWPQRVVRSNAFTISLSVALHGALFFAFWHIAFREERAPRRVIIPEARLAPAGGGSGPAKAGEMPKLAMQPVPPPPGGSGAAVGPAAGSALQLSELPVVAVNLTGSGGVVVGDVEGTARPQNGLAGLGGGSLMGAGYGGGTGGGGGGLAGPACSFFGAVGNAYKVVYVVDVSGSLGIYLEDIKRKANESIRGLTPTQQFQILTYVSDRDGKRPIEFVAGRLTYANEKNKSAATEFTKSLKVERGAFDPVQALTMAYALQPELVYLLSDGDYVEFPELLGKVRELYEQCPAKITVISFNPAQRNVRLLQSIASATGGNFRLVEESQLDK